MSKSIVQGILDNLQSSLTAIQIANGYSCNVNMINQIVQKQSEADPITINLLAQNDKLKEQPEAGEIRTVDIIFLIHCWDVDGDKILTDLTKFLYKDTSILPTYHNTLSTVSNLLSATITLKNNNYVWQGNKKSLALVLACEYFQEAENVCGNYATIVIPNILNGYATTATTNYLQSEINSISGMAISGINQWGTIEGSLSSQIDLWIELQSLTTIPINLNPYTLTSSFTSATSYLQNEFSGYATTGSLTGINLSGYSLTSHNHSLSSLNEKSYNDLTEKPTIPVGTDYSLTSHIHNQYASTSCTAGLTSTGSLTAYATNSLTGAFTLTSNFGFVTSSVFAGINNSNAGTNNVAMGASAFQKNTSGINNAVLGSQALQNCLTGTQNVAIGYQAGNGVNGHDNMCIGTKALINNGTGLRNVAIGTEALYNGNAGYNIGIGYEVAYMHTSSTGTIAIGYATHGGYNGTWGGNITAKDNITIGTNSSSKVNGNNNIVIGAYSLTANASSGCANNVVIGSYAGGSLSGNNSVFIGYQAGASEKNGNTLYIHNSGSTLPLIYGNFSISALTINGSATIGNLTSNLVGFYGSTGTTKQIGSISADGTLASVTNSVNDLISKFKNLGLIN